METKNYAIAGHRPKIHYVYGLTLFLLALTGFAQMPIFKRYYIADIPGLGWLAEFYTTHFLHYLGAAGMLAVGSYFAAEFLLVTRRYRRLSASGTVRAAILCGIMISGILLVVRNSFFVPFSPQLVIALLLAHLGLTMVFLFFALYCKIAGKPWAVAKQENAGNS